MTTFAFPPIMHPQQFDAFSSGEAFGSYTATSQRYPTSTGSEFMDGSYAPTFSTFDAIPGIQSFATRSPDIFSYPEEQSNLKMERPYSPAISYGEPMGPPQLSASSESGASIRSTSSSAMASPHLFPQQVTDGWNPMMPAAYQHDVMTQEPYNHSGFFSTGADAETLSSTIATEKLQSFLDPAMLGPPQMGSPLPFPGFSELPHAQSPQLFEHPPSPAASHFSTHSHASRTKASPSASPYLRPHQYHPYSLPSIRRMSVASSHSGLSNSSRRSGSFGLDDESSEKGRCPIPDCGRVFKDLKAHMLTHQASRPEKCPIPTCEYHTKGFARKYDKNRHTLTHYKGTMVCGFCPGSGSAAEKSFNRADVFKRHLTTIHDVEQTPPNSKRKSPGNKKSTGATETTSTSGACSTCHLTFPNPQEFYDHLDECVLRIVQQVDPSEGINEKHLTDISQHDDVKETLERNNLSNELDYTVPSYNEVDEDEDEDEDAEADDSFDITSPRGNPRSGKGAIKAGKKNQS